MATDVLKLVVMYSPNGAVDPYFPTNMLASTDVELLAAWASAPIRGAEACIFDKHGVRGATQTNRKAKIATGWEPEQGILVP